MSRSEVERKFTFWVVYDAMGDRKYIKTDRRTGCLAFFDTERHAAIFAADCAGADYKELVLYSCPQPAPDAALVEPFDAGRRAAQAEADGLSAPDVQGEPVAEVVWPDVEGRRGGFRQFGHSSSPRLPAGTKLYMHPQPAEQQPDVAGLVEALEFASKTLTMACFEGEVTRRIDAALAAYRKGGEV